MKIFIFSSFFMMNIFTLFSQTKGIVLDSNNKPLNEVNILFSDQNVLLFSNEDGEFVTELDIPNSSYISFYKDGYSSKILKYESDVELKIILEKLHIILDEVGVVESHSELGNSRLINIEKKSLSSQNSTSMVEDIAELSGVDMISSGLGIQKVVVRGLSGMRVVTYLNGMQINNQQWANDHGIGFTDLGLSEVELIKGASALKHGSEAIGGLLYFKDAPFIANDKLKGFISTGFNNSSLLINSKFGVKFNKKNLFFNLYGQYAISSDYRLPDNTYLFNSRFKQNAIKFSLGYRYRSWQNIFRGQIHAETLGLPGHVHGDPSKVNLTEITSSELNLSSDFNPTRPTQFVNNQLLIYETNYMINNFKFEFYAGHFINNLKEYEKWTRPAFDLSLSNTLLSPSLRYISNKLTLQIGSQFVFQENKNNINDRLVPDASSFNLGPYALIEYEKNNFGVNSGIRYDYKRLSSDDQVLDLDYDNSFNSTSFSSGIYYGFIDHILRMTFSGAYRSPHVSELFSDGVHHGTSRYEIGDKKLGIEYANQIDLKYQWSNDHLGIVINPFIQNISDFISLVPTDSVISGYKVYNYMQYNKVEINGVEMNLHYHPHQMHNLHFEQSYSFLQASNNSKHGLALVPANSIKNKILFKFNDYERLLKFDYLSIYHTYKFKQDSYAEYEELTDSYNVINLQIGLKFSSQFHCSLGLNNIFNETYTPHISRVRGIAGGVPNPGRFFNITLKHEF
jgi:iron complex outermembrane recepter protein